MKVILIKDNASSQGPICLSGAKILSMGIIGLFVLPVALGLLAYWVAASIDRSFNPFVDPEYRVAVESRVNGQEQEISKTRQ